MLYLHELTEVTGRVQGRAGKFFHEFRGFVFKQNILALAIAVIIGTATNNMVQALIADVFMPMVNLVIKDQSWVDSGVTIGGYWRPDPAKTQLLGDDGKPVFNKLGEPVIQKVWMPNKLLLGHLLWQFTNLVVIGIIAYFMSRYLLRPPPPAPAGPPTRACPSCLETVLVDAKVCKYCTRDLPAVAPVPTGSADGQI